MQFFNIAVSVLGLHILAAVAVPVPDTAVGQPDAVPAPVPTPVAAAAPSETTQVDDPDDAFKYDW
ncbi:hypothetical protein VHEMI04351 [[Torrubiella] hemipterigena]|uniref:Uncharacterized protein n=1 Tax=[Torrubiella] hemipterigena TaxID=1531966 RepID=A0A0A1SV13_9HYPO|nr:hypothetical protein VHEMI04351 [[Torrubiella] hemipterigena]